MKYLIRLPNRELVLFFVVVVAIFSFLSKSFRTSGNFENILGGFSHMGILAVGQAFPILLGGIDLSVGSIIALSGMIAFDGFLIFSLPGQVVVPLMLVAAAVAGAVNGMLIVRLRLQPFIATLATMAAYRGLTYAISGRRIFPELATQSINDGFLLGYVPSADRPRPPATPLGEDAASPPRGRRAEQHRAGAADEPGCCLTRQLGWLIGRALLLSATVLPPGR
jgi:ribose/xylose/arabinose/galactoside ABC-type transport system permease subunit